MTRQVKIHSFAGVKYDIHIYRSYGYCDRPDISKDNPDIALPDGLPFGNKRGAKFGLINLLHECLHASNYNTHEETVDRVSTEIGNLLWRLGYRRTK